MAIKASLSNIADVLLDWDDVHNDDFCSWRGVFCDNVSLTVQSLYICYPCNYLRFILPISFILVITDNYDLINPQ